MALTQKEEIGKVEISGEFKILSVRTDKIILEDGVEISRTFHRHTVTPDADISGEDSEVQDVCAAVHTQDVKYAYELSKSE